MVNLPLKLAVVAALMATAFPALAATPSKVSPLEFFVRLREQIGSRKDLAATQVAARYFGNTIRDPVNRRNVERYARAVVKRLRLPVVIPRFNSLSTNLLIQHLCAQYFSGQKRVVLADHSFNRALQVFLKSLPPIARTAATVEMIRKTMGNFASRNEIPPEQFFAYFEAVIISAFGSRGDGGEI